MCGINGIFNYGRATARVDPVEIERTRDAMASRGPQAAGLWISEEGQIGLGHRRLSIIDLSELGNQPMTIDDGSLTITYNGEIYNYQCLRTELESNGHRFRSGSDTEVLLHLYQEHGARMLSKLRGMFAFAIWDSKTSSLFLARDPFGIKPLYYADDGRTLRFASQVKALIKGGSIDTAPDPAGHAGFLLWGHVPEPFTLHKGIRQLPAGSSCVVDDGGMRDPASYTNPQAWFAANEGPPADLRAALLDTVDHHFVADVPVSVFLSAGRDSTTLLALASEARQEALHAVTLAYPEYAGTDQDETPLAAKVARQYGAIHTVRNLSRDGFHEELHAALEAMDQPSVDGLNTYFVSRAATKEGDVRVALSGLGADELFGGYPSFRQVPKLARTLSPTRVAPGLFRGINRTAVRLGVLGASPKAAALLEFGGTLEGAYLLRRALFLPIEIQELLAPDFAREGLERLATLERLRAITNGLETNHAKVAALEMTVYMRDRLLRDSDWAGMAHSLEIRVPFVDLELLRRIGGAIASPHPPSKEDMASAPRVPLPQAVIKRPKTGFTIPIQAWMKEVSPRAGGGDPHRAWALHIYTAQAGKLALTGKGLAR